jgi:hypothetical protein
MTSITKINNLVKSIFGEQENFESGWTKNQKIQQQLKSILNASFNKPLKDPNAPKRGKSSYLFFCGEMRNEVKETLGEQVSATSITKELGKMWNTIKSSTKSTDKSSMVKFQKMAQEDKDRYESEKEIYVPSADFLLEASNVNVKGKQRRRKDPNAPKRSKSAYLFFCNDFRDRVTKENPDFKATETTSELGSRWNTLKADSSRANELSKYHKMAAEDKIRYSDEMAAADVKESTKQPVKKSTVSKKVVAKKEVIVNKVLNGYQGFCQAHRGNMKTEHPTESAKDITKRLATMWKKLNQEEQTAWKSGCVAVTN